MATSPSTASFIAALRDHQLLDPTQLDDLARTPSAQSDDPRALAGVIVKRGWLTPYQVNQILQGRLEDLILGPYLLLERLGAGGMGQVFKAVHRLMKRVVALKVMHPNLLRSPDAVARFRREIEAVARLSHPYIVAAHDAVQIAGRHALITEFVEGKDLAALVCERGPLPISTACACIRQAALGLQHAHEHRLVHRDIKPSNILLTSRGGDVKILDLGLARLQQDEGFGKPLTRVGEVMGTPDFIAPEQIKDARAADHRADIYSLGCTFYFLITARPPFPEGTPEQKLAWHLHTEPPPVATVRPDVPAEVAAVIRKMMSRRPEDRHPSAAAVADALAAWVKALVSEPTMAPGQSALNAEGNDTCLTTSEPGRPTRTCQPRVRRRLLTLSAVLLLAVVPPLCYVAFLRSEAQAPEEVSSSIPQNPPSKSGPGPDGADRERGKPPPMPPVPSKPIRTVVLQTTKGAITLELDTAGAPKLSQLFVDSVRQNSFNERAILHTRTHAQIIIDATVAAPDLDGKSNKKGRSHVASMGTLAAEPRPGNRSVRFVINAKQWQSYIPHHYTFGKVVAGMDVVNMLAKPGAQGTMQTAQLGD